MNQNLLCSVCGGACKLLDVVDFNKSCEEFRGKSLELSGLPVYYAYCIKCGYSFAPELMTWTLEQFEKRIYNNDYVLVDPDYLDIRPQTNAANLIAMFGDNIHSIKHLDYGGGSGLLSQLLRESNWQSNSYDPFVDRSISIDQLGKFDLITAFEVFEHVTDVNVLMSNLRSLLSPNGIILFSTLLSDGEIQPGQRIIWWYASPRNGHISLFSKHSLEILAQHNGFTWGSLSNGLHVLFSKIPHWAISLISNNQKIHSSLQENVIESMSEDQYDDFHQGLAFLASKDFVNAAESFETVVSQFPDNADVHNNLGIAYFEIGFTDDAKDEFKAATKIDPKHAEAWKNLGKAIRDTGGNPETAARCFRKALTLVPDFDDAWMMLGTTLLDRGRSAEAVKCFRKSLELNPYNCDAHSNMLFAMNYLTQISQADLLSESLKWSDVHTAGISAIQHETGTDRFRSGRLHIGFVSGDFKRHPVGYHLLPILAAHDREQFAVYCYETIHEPDDLTTQMQEYVDGWRDISRLSDDDAARVVCNDRIDILIDLAGYTKGSRLRLFAHKPAPVQVSWLGYFNTTGVRAIDYMVADETTIPLGEEHLYSEKIIRLPGSRFCYAPPDYAPQVVEPPVLNNGFITFGSFNNVAKLSPETVQLWSRVLMAVPGSRLLLKWSTLGRKKERDRLLKKFTRSGIDAERLLLRGRSSHSDMLQEYGDVDITLDPFPFSGGMTSCESLWMGVPVLTLLGDKPAGRQTAGFLRTIGLPEWVALTEEQFVSHAIHAASNPEGLKTVRYGLRDRMTASTLCDGVRFTQNLESVFREISLK